MTITKFLILLFISTLFLKSKLLSAQQPENLRHQISLGIWPSYFSPPYVTLEYKKYIKGKKYYTFGIEGAFEIIKDNQTYKDVTKYQIAPRASIGINYKFLRI